MTNITTFVFTLLVTNWISIGTFTDRTNQLFDVQEGHVWTNTMLDVAWCEGWLTYQTNGIRTWEPIGAVSNEFVLKSNAGPVIGERKVLIPALILTNSANWWNQNSPVRIVTN